MKSRGRLCDWREADTEEGRDLTVPARRSSQAGGGVRAHSQPLKAGSPGTVWAEASPMGTERRASFPLGFPEGLEQVQAQIRLAARIQSP